MLQSQKKLQVIQPKIKELQTKYKDDQAKLGMEMLELYKKE
jgi:YidC/Oxa1 family membrane protein insertase